jgi:glyoxylase-like metal-dependent hydrolase (beta-lactamase superfamily II)
MTSHGPLNVETLIEPSFQENGYLIWPADAPQAWIIDPGYPPQTDAFLARIRELELTPEAIVLTHGHVDHIAGVETIRATYTDLKLVAPRDDEPMLGDPTLNLSAQLGAPVVAGPIQRTVVHGDTLTLGALTFHVIDVSGHSPGGVALHCPDAGVVFTGDALFAGSIGRTDFPGSSTSRLLTNIRENLLSLPPETVVYSGHGPATTIARERDTNPFI